MTFSNRAEAADRLVELLRPWQSGRPIVVALAPSGVATAVTIAHALDTPLDAIAVHELTAPGVPAGVLGAAASLAVSVLRGQGVKGLVLAVPVGARAALDRLRPRVDALVCVREMPWPRPVREWYEDYPEITDRHARRLLRDEISRNCVDERPKAAHARHRKALNA